MHVQLRHFVLSLLFHALSYEEEAPFDTLQLLVYCDFELFEYVLRAAIAGVWFFFEAVRQWQNFFLDVFEEIVGDVDTARVLKFENVQNHLI